MGYRLIQDETLHRGLKRIARDEIDAAIEHLGTKDPEQRDHAIHEARKSIKKLRGLMRMLVPALGDSAHADIDTLGALGRSLSEVRDAAAMVEAVDLLSRHTREAKILEELATLRRGLQKRGRETIARADVEIVAEGGIIGLRQVKRHIASWRLEDHFDAIEPGLKKSYQRGRRALKRVHAEPSAENFHGLRKRVKDRWYQVRILEGIWPHAANSPEKALGELQEDLGDNHNLDVLLGLIPADSDALRELLRETQKKLREKSLAAALEFYLLKPNAYVAELRSLWEQWRLVPKSAKSSGSAARRASSAA